MQLGARSALSYLLHTIMLLVTLVGAGGLLMPRASAAEGPFTVQVANYRPSPCTGHHAHEDRPSWLMDVN